MPSARARQFVQASKATMDVVPNEAFDFGSAPPLADREKRPRSPIREAEQDVTRRSVKGHVAESSTHPRHDIGGSPLSRLVARLPPPVPALAAMYNIFASRPPVGLPKVLRMVGASATAEPSTSLDDHRSLQDVHYPSPAKLISGTQVSGLASSLNIGDVSPDMRPSNGASLATASSLPPRPSVRSVQSFPQAATLGVSGATSPLRVLSTPQPYFGIRNNGNTCFAAATVQLLARCRPFVTKLEATTLQRPAHEALRAQFRLRATRVATIHNIARVFDYFFDGRQHDAHEFLVALLARLDAEAAEVTGNPTWVAEIIGGKSSNLVLCANCDHEIVTEDSFSAMSIPISEEVKSLSDMIQATSVPQPVPAYECDSCRSKNSVTLTTSIVDAPPVLLLHLLRFSVVATDGEVVMTKSSLPVHVPPEIEIHTVNGRFRYRLAGVVEHHGATMESGHYTAILHDEDDKWRKVDDSEVTTIEPHRAKAMLETSKTAFLVTYLRLLA
jgi:ubiquitin C-terminal hydrolase